MMEPNIPLCVNCDHFDGNKHCLHVRALYTDPASLVRGPAQVTYYTAEDMRRGVGSCGPLGKLWEPEKHFDQDYAHMDACAKAGVSESGPSR